MGLAGLGSVRLRIDQRPSKTSPRAAPRGGPHAAFPTPGLSKDTCLLHATRVHLICAATSGGTPGNAEGGPDKVSPTEKPDASPESPQVDPRMPFSYQARS